MILTIYLIKPINMNQERKSSVGDPIWVETIMTAEEYGAAARKYPALFSSGSTPIQFNQSHHGGGKWRAGMGKGYSESEIVQINKNLDNLHNLMKTKKFQKRPDYGPHAEAKP
jgi:hypothetical protein